MLEEDSLFPGNPKYIVINDSLIIYKAPMNDLLSIYIAYKLFILVTSYLI